MKKSLLVFSLLALFGCATGDFAAYDGGDVLMGKGGFSYKKNDIDVFKNSAPSKKFTIVGSAENSWLVPDKAKIGNLANSAKAAGGDAIILLDQGRELKEFIAKDQFAENDDLKKDSDVAGGAFSNADLNAATAFNIRAIVIKYAY